ncbi:MAG: S8 family peptidase, partial [Anaerolineales bacterium]|nr:S8 family peptidase [Anaerolineales bacterium]
MKKNEKPRTIHIINLFCFAVLSLLLLNMRTSETAVAGPADMVEVIVVGRANRSGQGYALGRAKNAIRDYGGELIKDLNIIGGVGALMPESALVDLEADGRIKNVFNNEIVEISSVGGVESVRDEFDYSTFSNNNGTVAWAGPWVEVGESDGPLYGKVQVLPYYDCASGHCLSYYAFDESVHELGAWREVDLSAALSATLTFDYRRWIVDNEGGTVAVQVSTDRDSHWTNLHVYPLNFSDDDVVTESIPLDAYLSPHTRIRFIGSGLLNGLMAIDNVEISFNSIPNTDFPSLVGADKLHDLGIDGSGITVAVLDTGYWSHEALGENRNGDQRVLARYDAIEDQWEDENEDSDGNGHGSHLFSIVFNNRNALDGELNGIAPNANLVSVKAFNASGAGSYMDIINGINWVINNKDTYNIRVLNLSFSATPQSYYWDDPLNQAVMQAWQAGIVVVAAAGNNGPAPMTIGVPGNVPYIITAGAMSDNNTPADLTDDFLSPFSAAGPTVEGFVKPDVLAPGQALPGLMAHDSQTAVNHPDWYMGVDYYYNMSGTSQAAAVTSAVVALMLDADPNLSPDDVKCRLLTSSRPFQTDLGDLAYSIFQQGAGVINAYDAVNSTAIGCANQGLDIVSDLAGTEHYGGLANYDPATGEYYIFGLDGYAW